jgi:hypothetical protein
MTQTLDLSWMTWAVPTTRDKFSNLVLVLSYHTRLKVLSPFRPSRQQQHPISISVKSEPANAALRAMSILSLHFEFRKEGFRPGPRMFGYQRHRMEVSKCGVSDISTRF